MGCIGDLFRKIGKGIKHAAGWASEHIIRPAVKVINHPLVQTGLSKLGPVGAAISKGGQVASAAYGVYDKLTGKSKAPTPSAPPPKQLMLK
jgi:hypothetical protein